MSCLLRFFLVCWPPLETGTVFLVTLLLQPQVLSPFFGPPSRLTSSFVPPSLGQRPFLLVRIGSNSCPLLRGATLPLFHRVSFCTLLPQMVLCPGFLSPLPPYQGKFHFSLFGLNPFFLSSTVFRAAGRCGFFFFPSFLLSRFLCCSAFGVKRSCFFPFTPVQPPGKSTQFHSQIHRTLFPPKKMSFFFPQGPGNFLFSSVPPPPPPDTFSVWGFEKRCEVAPFPPPSVGRSSLPDFLCTFLPFHKLQGGHFLPAFFFFPLPDAT